MLNKNLTTENIKWLVEEYQPKMGYGVNSKNINMFNDALNLMKGTNNPCPGCSCQYLTIAKIAASLFEQYKEEINKLYAESQTHKVVQKRTKRR